MTGRAHSIHKVFFSYYTNHMLPHAVSAMLSKTMNTTTIGLYKVKRDAFAHRESPVQEKLWNWRVRPWMEAVVRATTVSLAHCSFPADRAGEHFHRWDTRSVVNGGISGAGDRWGDRCGI